MRRRRSLSCALPAGGAFLALLAVLPSCSDGAAGAAGAADAGSARCAACHLPEYQHARHHAGEKPVTCAVCHTTRRWSPHRLEHEWPLTGAHADVECFECHDDTPPVFEGMGRACITCHLDTLENETFPDHQGFPRTCEDCHTTEAWLPATWNGRPIDEAEHEARVRGEAWQPDGGVADAGAPDAGPPDAGPPADAGRRRPVRAPRPRRPTTTMEAAVEPRGGPEPAPVEPVVTPPPQPPVTPPPPPPVDTTTSASRRR